MTDDEKAQAVLEMLVGVRRCEKCGEVVDGGNGYATVLDPPGGPLLCADCWWGELPPFGYQATAIRLLFDDRG